MTLTIRPFEPTQQAYEAVVAIKQFHHPDRHFSVANLREFDQVTIPSTLYLRFVGEVAGQVVAVSAYGQPPRLLGTDKYILEFDLHPDHENEAFVHQIYDHLLHEIAPRHPIAFLTETNHTNLARIGFLAQQGFTLVQRENNSAVDLTAFDPASFLSLQQKMGEQQIAIYALAQLQAGDPDWLPKLYDLFWDFRQDMPSAEPPVRESLQQFSKRFARASLRPDAWFIATDETSGKLADGLYVGLSNLWLEPDVPDKAWTGQTGVARTHRRRGIATAMKVRAMTFAKEQQISTLFTSNDATNPMFDLNLALGFKPTRTRLQYRKQVIENKR